MMTPSRAISDIDMQILLAKDEHMPLVAQLEKKVFSEPWSEGALGLFLGNGGFCAVCVDADHLAGYCTVVTVLDEAQIINVATDEKYRRRGVADAVLKYVMDECRARSIVSVSLEVRKSNAPAIALYERQGFETVGSRKSFYRDPTEDALVMIKNIE